MKDYLEETIKKIEEIFSKTEATQWINSPEVTKWCEESRKEENENS